jgi:arylsulfatase A-like enzyme
MSKPNILIIVTDQMNIDAISAYRNHFKDKHWGAHWVATPNLDRMVEQGTSFTESHSTNPVCGPARSSIFTGRMTTETAVTYNNIGLDKDIPNMGEWFEQNSNYERFYCGKWHVGGPWNYPHVEGPRKIPGFTTIPVGHGGTGDFIDFQVSGLANSWIRNYKRNNPFLLVASLMNPHDICFWTKALAGKKAVAPDDYYKLDKDLPDLPPNHEVFHEGWGGAPTKYFSKMEWRNYAYDYYRMVEKMDADVGRILNAVDSREDETIVLLTSDHGEGLGRHSRVQKWHPFDESIKVPFLVYYPGKVQKGIINNTHLVSGVDMMSTVCDFAGINAPDEVSGYSLRPLLEGKTDIEWRDHVYAEFGLTGRIIRTKQFKYVKKYEKSGQPLKPFVLKENGNPSGFIKGRGSDNFKEVTEKLLFDMENDPWEMNNLANLPEYKEVRRQHEELLVNHWENKLVQGKPFLRA